jgi:hypothetical protein
VLEAEGMTIVGMDDDEGENHYYFAQKAYVTAAQQASTHDQLPG